jgi:hypothetical protein
MKEQYLSQGINRLGKATAKLVRVPWWTVIAAMRQPEKETEHYTEAKHSSFEVRHQQ